MPQHNIYIYIALMVLVVNLIRVLPVVLIRGEIKNRFIRSFLYYVPYVTLAVMTFPAIMQTTNSEFSGLIALLLGVIAAWCGLGLFPVAVICSVVVLVAEMLI